MENMKPRKPAPHPPALMGSCGCFWREKRNEDVINYQIGSHYRVHFEGVCKVFPTHAHTQVQRGKSENVESYINKILLL